MGDHTASERTVGGAVFVENWKFLFQDLFGIADASGNNCAPDTFGNGGCSHHATPQTCFDIIGSVPDYNPFRFEVIQHLRAEGHLSLDHHIGGTFDGKGFAADGHLIAQRHNVAGEILVKQTIFTHDVIDTSGIKFFVTLAQLFYGNRDLAIRNPLADGNKFIQFHQTGFFGFFSHIFK